MVNCKMVRNENNNECVSAVVIEEYGALRLLDDRI
jgi:hypothetical protein